MTKKDIYNANPLVDMRTHINGETAIKPYYYFRCGALHVRYTVDRVIELTPAEVAKLKVDMTTGSKQEILEKVPDISVKTVELVLSKMLKENKIKKIGSFKDARYMRKI